MAKMALTVRTSEIYNLVFPQARAVNRTPECEVFTGIPNIFYDLGSELVDRAICETDTNTLQILPYLILVNQDETGEKTYFTYQRGKAGEESRLHANYSIGVGGHMEEAVTEIKNLRTSIIECAVREVEEEVGLKLQAATVDNALNYAYLVHDRSNEVGQVHLGLFLIIHVTSKDIESKEPGVLDNTSWNTKEQLKELKLENWSKIFVDSCSH